MSVRVARLAIALAILGLWEAGGRYTFTGQLFFPPPTRVAAAAVRLIANGTLERHVGATLARLLAGFAIGSVPAVALGTWLGISRRMRQIVDPFLAAAHATPKIAIYPLLLLFFGIGESAMVALVALASFFPLTINTCEGVRHIDPTYFDVARSCGASRVRTLLRVILPASLPMILTGVRLALTLALILTIATEIISARTGLGCLVWISWQTLRTTDLFVALGTASLVGVAIRAGFDRALLRLVPWREGRTA